MPKELISFFLENANESTSFNRIQSTFTSNNSSRHPTRSNKEVKFPAPLNYNYSTKVWQSIYKTQSFDSSKVIIPWYREKDSRPVYPFLDDTITFLINSASETVSLMPYSSNECPILKSLVDIQCLKLHCWCEETTVVSYEGEATFDESFKICRGSVKSLKFTFCRKKFREKSFNSDAIIKRFKVNDRNSI